MHVTNNGVVYNSLEDAISRWPKTAAGFVARLDHADRIEFVAPYVSHDLLRLLITNTPPFDARISIMRELAKENQRPRLFVAHQVSATGLDV